MASVSALRAERRGRTTDHEFVVLQALALPVWQVPDRSWARVALSALDREDSEGSISGLEPPRTLLNSWLEMALATALV